MSDPIEAIAGSLEAIDKRLSDADQRMLRMEGHIADSAQASDESARHLSELRQMFVEMGQNIEDLKAIVGNYVDATKGLRNDSRQLISEVRERLKVAGG